jgi:hypothetical protein
VRAGEEKLPIVEAELGHLAPQLHLAPYRPPATLPESWPYAPSSYLELAHLAEQHNTDAVVQLHPQSDPLPWRCILALAHPVLRDGVGLSIARYQLSRYRGLLNSAALRPLTRALYCAEIYYPLAPDAAYSRAFLQHLASVVPAGDSALHEDLILWPSLVAINQSIPVAQVGVGVGHFAQPPNPDITSLLTRILNSMFAEIERSASYWQRGRPLYPLRNIAACQAPVQAKHPPNSPLADHPELEHESHTDTTPMLESFHLAVANLQEIWSLIMSPGTLLGIKRLVEQPAAEFKMADTLWVRIVWDFLLAYRNRSLNRTHIFGALVPLYMAWAASHVTLVEDLSDAEAEIHIAALALTFGDEKPYLMARWRWPDRFTP